ncbi:hypothetical protein H5410_009767 [Solanum commersonii]|uniref:Uncharacterized protein n=1 Tax=Solanum commersonii TaxID=4109 RepID=A0A9J6AIV0_SOLCO|nr:hypothetical protein H5410_009767 [Solanum commersonii]
MEYDPQAQNRVDERETSEVLIPWPSSKADREVDTPIYHLHHHNHLQPKEKLATYNPNSIIIVNHQEKAAPSHKPKVSYYISTNGTSNYYIDTDESSDIKAANYISCVQERFRSLFNK